MGCERGFAVNRSVRPALTAAKADVAGLRRGRATGPGPGQRGAVNEPAGRLTVRARYLPSAQLDEIIFTDLTWSTLDADSAAITAVGPGIWCALVLGL